MWLVLLLVVISLIAGRERVLAYVMTRECIEGVYFSYGENKFMVLEACTARFAGTSAGRTSVSGGVHVYKDKDFEVSVKDSAVSGLPVHSVLNVKNSTGFNSEMIRCVRWPFGKLEFLVETKGVSRRHSRVVIEGAGDSVEVVVGNNGSPRKGYAMLADGHVFVKISGVLRAVLVDITQPYIGKATLIDRSGMEEDSISYRVIGKPVLSNVKFQPIPTSEFDLHSAR